MICSQNSKLSTYQWYHQTLLANFLNFVWNQSSHYLSIYNWINMIAHITLLKWEKVPDQTKTFFPALAWILSMLSGWIEESTSAVWRWTYWSSSWQQSVQEWNKPNVSPGYDLMTVNYSLFCRMLKYALFLQESKNLSNSFTLQHHKK